MSTKKLIFSPPLEHDGAKADAIVLVEPTALQVVTAEKAGVAEIGVHATRVRDTALVGAVGQLPIDLVRRMPARQFKEAAAFVNGFSVAPKSPLVNLDPELAIDLDPRIEKAGRIVDRLELREPTTGEIEEAQRKLASGVNPATLRESQIHLVALVAEMPRAIIEMLPIHVLDEASRYLLGFT